MPSAPPPELRAIVSPEWSSRVPTADVVVLLLHGYGADERDLLGLVEALRVVAPWASLRAPLDLAGTTGAAWFPIDQLDAMRVGPVESATARIWAWVDAVLPERTRVLPIGFSQGGLMATQLLRSRTDRVVAPVVLAGLVLGAPQPADSTLAAGRPPAFWGRGELDSVIPPHAVTAAADFLAAHTTLTERTYAGLGHQISMTELADVAEFIRTNTGEDVIESG